jgi:proteasome lid subunit RPN8/RPN11
MKALGVAGMLLLGIAAGCGERALRDGDDEAFGADGGTGVAALSRYCAGGSRMELNGQDTTVAVTGRASMPAYANEQATVIFTPTGGDGTRILVTWHATDPHGSATPAKLDLAALPQAWSVTIYAGCSPGESGCSAPTDVVGSGLQGTLEVDGEFPDYEITLCLESAEPPANPRPELHSVRLWAAAVPAAYDFGQ